MFQRTPLLLTVMLLWADYLPATEETLGPAGAGPMWPLGQGPVVPMSPARNGGVSVDAGGPAFPFAGDGVAHSRLASEGPAPTAAAAA